MKAFTIILLLTGLLVSSGLSAMSLTAAVEQVKRNHQGKIVSARTQQTDSGRRHVIRLLTPKGQVKRIVLPAGVRSKR